MANLNVKNECNHSKDMTKYNIVNNNKSTLFNHKKSYQRDCPYLIRLSYSIYTTCFLPLNRLLLCDLQGGNDVLNPYVAL